MHSRCCAKCRQQRASACSFRVVTASPSCPVWLLTGSRALPQIVFIGSDLKQYTFLAKPKDDLRKVRACSCYAAWPGQHFSYHGAWPSLHSMS